MPSSCDMFVYSDVTSAVTRIAFSGRGGRDSRSCRKYLLCRMYEGSISGGAQVEDLQYVGRLLVREWFLKWNCFFMVWVRRFANFRTRWGVEPGGVGTKLRPKASTLVSVGDS